MARPGTPARSSTVLLVILALAFAIGAAAAFVAAASAKSPGPTQPATEVILTTDDLAVGFAVLFGIVIGIGVWVWIGSGRGGAPQRWMLVMLVSLVIAVLFVVILQVFGGAGASASNSGNSTAPPPVQPPPYDNGNGSLTGPGGVLDYLHLPSWSLFLGIAIVAIVVAVVVVPRARAYLANREPDGPSGPAPAEVEEVRQALAQAAGELESGSDPRAVVIALYATVLRRVGPMVGGVDTATPEEIRAQHLVRLGVEADVAESLTRLFEEARYSTHPMGAEAAERARITIAAAQEDLTRVAPPLP